MSFKEVKELRKAGKLHEAMELAKLSLIQNPDDIWNKRSIAWVHYDFLKQNASLDSYDSFLEHLKAIKDLDLPEDEKMVFDQAAFQIGKVLFGLKNPEKIEDTAINLDEFFEIIKVFHFTKPSDSYTFLYKAFHRFNKVWDQFLDFCDWWDYENFHSSDYLSEEYNGKKIMSIVEQFYVAYSKALFAHNVLAFGEVNPWEVRKERTKAFVKQLEVVVNTHPEYQYPAYYLSKLYLASSDHEHDALRTFLPFAKRKQNDFWVWDMLADLFSKSDNNLYLACLCKAVSLKSPEEFLTKVRQKLARELIERKLYPEAKTEIDKILKVRQENQYKRTLREISNWTNEDWYENAEAMESNSAFYKKHLPLAEEILYSDKKESLVVVEFVNKNKKMLTFLTKEKQTGFFKYSGHFKSPKVGQTLSVRMEAIGSEGFHKLLTGKESDEVINELVTEFSGQFSAIPNKEFGFIDDIFIDPRIAEEYNLVDGKTYTGKALQSFDKRKKSWGWKAISIS